MVNVGGPPFSSLFKDSEWKWTTEHVEAFLKLKEAIANAPVLKTITLMRS